MKLFIKTLLLSFLAPVLAFAQSNYKPGYVVDLKGDTLKGFIDYREWNKNPKQFSFKNSSGNTQVFNIQNATAFTITGLEYYERHIVSISTDPTDLNMLMHQVDTSFVSDTVFLKILQRGRYVSLYYYNDDIKSRFYLSETGDPRQPEELGYHFYYNNDESNTIKYIRRYRTQLQYVAQKNNVSNKDLESSIQQSKYDANDLESIVSKINGDKGRQMVSQNLFGTRWFAGIGVNYTDMTFNGDIDYGDSYALFPKVSMGLDFLTNKNTQQFFLRAEVAFTGDSHDFKNTYEQSELKFNQLTASIILQAYYNFYNSEKLKIFFGGGIPVNFSIYPDHYYVTEGGIDVTPIKQSNFPDYHMLWESFILKAGIVLNKKLEIYVGYSPATTLTDDYLDFAGNVVSYQAGVNFLFGAK